MPTAAQISEKWVKNTTAGVESYKEGVNAVTTNPAEAAIVAIPRQVEGVMRAAESGKTEAGLRRVTLASWKGATLGKGAARIGQGVRDARDKFQNFMTEFLPYVEQGRDQLPERGSLETNIQRMVQMVQWNAQFRRSR